MFDTFRSYKMAPYSMPPDSTGALAMLQTGQQQLMHAIVAIIIFEDEIELLKIVKK